LQDKRALPVQGFFIFLRVEINVMALPFFYVANLRDKSLVLDEDTSKHIAGVLRMKTGEALLLTDGNGSRAQATITDDNRKRCAVQIDVLEKEAEKSSKVCIAISLLKNAPRFEWFLEKATEIGVTEIIPLVCDRTEKETFRHDRMQNILVSAMLQSQQCWLPQLHQPTAFNDVINTTTFQHQFIAHCLPQQKQSLHGVLKKLHGTSIMLIGPEGDFTETEIEQALAKQFIPVTLGATRLRTETAGMVAAAWLCNAE
jgi:16S rRNA (uracil1498-N3)-methyltransferase